MKELSHLILKGLRKGYSKISRRNNQVRISGLSTNPDEVSDLIYQQLMCNKPCMIARFGATELSMLCNYISIMNRHHSVLNFIKGEESEWWWNPIKMQSMQNWSGFFPPDEEHLSRFCELMLQDAKYVDVLGRWLKDEEKIIDLSAVKSVKLLYLEPYHSSRPWSRALEGKRVLVVHPFAKLIETQYKNHREHLFANKDVLPSFELTTIPAVQSLCGQDNGFKDWFEALQWMKDEIDKQDYDIALIGCGAYGFHLAAHVKRRGKKAVHLGGALQLLFGIKGKRWENPNYGAISLGATGRYPALFNEHWVYPDERFKPANANKVEGGCYWGPTSTK